MDREKIESALEGATPGPWACHLGDEKTTCECKYVLAEYGGFGSIATIDSAESDENEWGDDFGPNLAASKANARLIVMAPDLAREVLRLMDVVKAADKLAQKAQYLYSAETLGDYLDPMVSIESRTIDDVLRSAESYRAAREGQPHE